MIQNLQVKMIQKWNKDAEKMKQKWSKNGAKMEQNCIRQTKDGLKSGQFLSDFYSHLNFF